MPGLIFSDDYSDCVNGCNFWHCTIVQGVFCAEAQSAQEKWGQS